MEIWLHSLLRIWVMQGATLPFLILLIKIVRNCDNYKAENFKIRSLYITCCDMKHDKWRVNGGSQQTTDLPVGKSRTEMQVRTSNAKWHKIEYAGDKNWFDLVEYTLEYPVVLTSVIERYCLLTRLIFLLFATTVSYTRYISTRTSIRLTYLLTLLTLITLLTLLT